MSTSIEEKKTTGTAVSLEDALKMPAVLEWYYHTVERYTEEFGPGGVIELSADSARLFFKAAYQFWDSAKPKLPPVGKDISPEDLAKTAICLRQIDDLSKKLEASGLDDDDERDERDEPEDPEEPGVLGNG